MSFSAKEVGGLTSRQTGTGDSARDPSDRAASTWIDGGLMSCPASTYDARFKKIGSPRLLA
jgi:hypothetical protein